MRITSFIPVVLLTLTACTPGQTSISEQNTNPLTASRYGDELADGMANLIIENDPVISDPEMREIVEEEIERGKDIAAAAREIQSEGMMGVIIGIKAPTTGFALYHENTLYLSSDFSTAPGASVRAYLTTAVDPRDTTDFPDATAVDLGVLQAAYGPQQYAVPSQKEEGKLRTFVLYDTKLNIIYGFAQLSKRS